MSARTEVVLFAPIRASPGKIDVVCNEHEVTGFAV